MDGKFLYNIIPSGEKDYIELRNQSIITKTVAFRDGALVDNSQNESRGTSARVLADGSFGFSASSIEDEAGIKDLIEKARKNSRELSNILGKRDIVLDSRDPFIRIEDIRPIDKELPSSMLDLARAYSEYIKKNFTDLTSYQIASKIIYTIKHYANSQGAISSAIVPKSLLLVTMYAQGNDGPVSLFNSYGGLGYFEDLFKDEEGFKAGLENQYKHTLNKKEAVFAQSGIKEVVLSPKMTGLLAHEAIGHTTEADFVNLGSVAGPLQGKKAVSEKVSLVDHAHTDILGRTCPMPVYVDDEGVLAEDAYLIRDGKIESFMHNRESALMFKQKALGNARANDYFDEPLIRMRNTCILPGQDKLEDMIASIEDGYYLIDISNGQADSTAEFMFGCSCGYEIKNGKLGKAIKDTTVSGMAFEVLDSVSMVGDDLEWLPSSWCGKKQTIPVGMGGPHIKCKLVMGGK